MAVGLARLEAVARDVAIAIDKTLADLAGERLGFALFVFEFGAPTVERRPHLTYLSNVQRPDMIATVKEWLVRQAMPEEPLPLLCRVEITSPSGDKVVL